MSWLGTCWRFITAWPRALVGYLHTALCALMTPEGRRGWAVMIAWGCGVVESCFVAIALFLVRSHPMLVFWIGCSAQFIIVVVITAFMGLLVKRNIGGGITKDGANINISDHDA